GSCWYRCWYRVRGKPRFAGNVRTPYGPSSCAWTRGNGLKPWVSLSHGSPKHTWCTPGHTRVGRARSRGRTDWPRRGAGASQDVPRRVLLWWGGAPPAEVPVPMCAGMAERAGAPGGARLCPGVAPAVPVPVVLRPTTGALFRASLRVVILTRVAAPRITVR